MPAVTERPLQHHSIYRLAVWSSSGGGTEFSPNLIIHSWLGIEDTDVETSVTIFDVVNYGIGIGGSVANAKEPAHQY
ncbi:hypothetical protein T11_17258 [Trichinella zimbabwensis]|uniref:Uncharacterized protein n=1 Tax=Trichinella zimbabwensis TaxID=268475 RepID=A0A0V1GVH9_9BILA|nr:hypothetical protein T11_17258 [Trichinella zimbabwensis]